VGDELNHHGHHRRQHHHHGRQIVSDVERVLQQDLSRRDQDLQDVVTKEMDLIAAEARNEGKPDDIIERIVDGRINSFYKDNVLVDQVFVRSDRFEGTVGEMVQQLATRMGENISISSMAIVEIGAG
jgi:elongation factor Ts